MDCDDLMSFDSDVPTGILIDVSPMRPTTAKRNTVATTCSSPGPLKSGNARANCEVGNLLGLELELATSKSVAVVANEPPAAKGDTQQGNVPSVQDAPNERNPLSPASRSPSLSSLLDFDEDGGFSNESPPSLDSTPPNSPAIHPNDPAFPQKNVPAAAPDFDRIAEESQNIVSWMKEESEFSIGDQVTYKTANYSATRSSRKAAFPDLNDVVKRYKRLSSAISTPTCDDQSAAGARSSPVAKVNPVVKQDAPLHKSWKPSSKISDHSDPSGLRSRTGQGHMHQAKKAVAFVDVVSHSPEVTKRPVLPRMLNLAHPHSSKENAKPVAKVGPMKAVKPLTSMVKPPLAKEGGMVEAKKLKPLGTIGQVPVAARRPIAHHPMKRRSGSVDRVTAGMKSVTLSSPSVTHVTRTGLQTRLRSSSSNRIGVPSGQTKK